MSRPLRRGLRRVRRPVLVAGLVAGLLFSTSAAQAERWGGREPVGDVHGYTYDREPQPCGTVTDVDSPDAAGYDITRLAVKHNRNTIKVKVSFTDLADTGRFFSAIHLRTAADDWFVEIDRWQPGGPPWTFFAPEPDFPDPADLDECEGFTFTAVGKACRDLAATIDTQDDVVKLFLPRVCLGSPRWVQASAEVNGTVDDEVLFYDRWVPAGLESTGFVGPYGPRVASSPAVLTTAPSGGSRPATYPKITRHVRFATSPTGSVVITSHR